MKETTITLAVFLFAALSSCSSPIEPKEISPTSTEFTSGELAKLIEVVDEPCQLSFVEKDEAISTQYIKLKVKLRLTKESPEFQKADARDINFTRLLSVATVNLVDEIDTKIQDLSVKSEDFLKLKKLLQGNNGDVETIIFEGEYHNHDNAPKWFENATAFTPNLTGDVEFPQKGLVDGSYFYEGIWASQKYSSSPCRIKFEKNGNTLTNCTYTNLKFNETILLTGTVTDENLCFKAIIKGKNLLLNFPLNPNDLSSLIGTGVDEAHSDKAQVIVKKVDINTPLTDESDEDEKTELSSSDSEDWDALLESYEEYVDKSIELAEDITNGENISADEYKDLMEQGMDLSQKIARAQMDGTLSTSQLNRFNELTAKMTEASLKLQKKFQ